MARMKPPDLFQHAIEDLHRVQVAAMMSASPEASYVAQHLTGVLTTLTQMQFMVARLGKEVMN